MKILVVDDDFGVRRSLMDALMMRGHMVLGADTSQWALDLLTEAEMDAEPFDVAICDWDLGPASETNGPELVSEIKTVWPEAGVVLWSGLDRPEIGVADLQISKLDFGELLSWLVIESDTRAGR